jgi:DNA-3-methyladenine glycosylase
VARELLGSWLVRRGPSGWRAARIVETEAYVSHDPANHAFRGPTDRNRSMFGPPGTLYVYRIHQVHCANVVTLAGEAVLLRAAEPLTEGLGETKGPGRLCRAFGFTRTDDGKNLRTSDVRVVAGAPPAEPVIASGRVGIRKAVERPLRFALDGNPYVSSPRPVGFHSARTGLGFRPRTGT